MDKRKKKLPSTLHNYIKLNRQMKFVYAYAIHFYIFKISKTKT